MDFVSTFDLISGTFADQLNGYAVFETASGNSLRVDLEINEQWFRAVFQDSTGSILVVTPGNITALENGQPVQSESVDTQAALDAWKSQPPITLAPVSGGLSQLQVTNTQINQVISSLLQISGSGSLAVAFIPTLCWFDARYPQVLLPGLVLQELEGRICLRDIAFTSSEISFVIEAHGQCKSGQLNFGKPLAIQVQELEIDLHTSSYLELPTGNVEGEIWHSSLSTVTGAGKIEINASEKPSSLPLEVQGLSSLINDVKLRIIQRAGGEVDTYVFGGPLILQAKQSVISNYNFEWNSDIVTVAVANLTDLYIDLKFNSRGEANPYLSGSFSIPSLTAKVDVWLSDVAAKDLQTELSLQGQFSSSQVAINYVSLASNSGQIIFRDSNDKNYIIDNFKSSILVNHLIVVDARLQIRLNVILNTSKSSASQLVFEGSAILENINFSIDVYVGSRYVVRKKLKTVDKSVAINHRESLQLTLPIDFDPVSNRIRVVNPKITDLEGVLSPLAAIILDKAIDLLLPQTLIIVELPVDMKVNTFRLDVRSPGDEIEISLDVAAEKVQFIE